MEQAATFETFLWTMERQLELYQYVKSLKAVVLQSYFLGLQVIDFYCPWLSYTKAQKISDILAFYIEKFIFWKNVSSVAENI